MVRFLQENFLFTIKRYKKMEFGPHLSEISHIKFVSTIKLNTFKVNGPHFADIFFVSTIKEYKKMAFGSFFMKVFYFFLNNWKEISKVLAFLLFKKCQFSYKASLI